MLVTEVCAMYCRFCTRNRLVANDDHYIRPDLRKAVEYIKRHTEVRDVLISGGDPLLLPTAELDRILGAVRAVPHVELLRVGSRVPCVFPQRVDAELCKVGLV
jgi:lysine 2,3-aminomutase